MEDHVTSVFDVVRREILSLEIKGLAESDIRRESLLIEDLGLDSFKFVDLTVGLEDALGLWELPMQEWIDAQVEAGLPLTVGCLVEACERAIEEQGRATP